MTIPHACMESPHTFMSSSAGEENSGSAVDSGTPAITDTSDKTSNHKPNRMLLELLEDSNKYDMRSQCSLPESWLRKRPQVSYKLTHTKVLKQDDNMKKAEKNTSSSRPSRKNKNKLVKNGVAIKSTKTVSSLKKNKSRKEATKRVTTSNGASKEHKVISKSNQTKLPDISNLANFEPEESSQTAGKSSSDSNQQKKGNESFIVDSDEKLILAHDFFNLDNFSESFNGNITSSLILSTKDTETQRIIRVYSIMYPEHYEEYKIDFASYSKQYYNSIVEIGKFIEYAVMLYMPQPFYDQGTKIVRSLNEAFDTMNQELFIETVEEYNKVITSIPRSSIITRLRSLKSIPRSFIHDFLQIAYSRCILPNVNGLKEYQGFSNFVYGELLPSFLSTAFDQCGLKSEHLFMDLGSGVGNCVVQASLEYGCKLSFGCEIMQNASELAELQLEELRNRCALWGIRVRPIEFCLRKSFVDNHRVNELLPQCDIILINNFIFDAKLNQMVERLIQRLKPGCKLITLRNLRPSGYTINFYDVENILNRLKVQKFVLPDDSVSWTYKGGGEYYISTVESDIDDSVFHSYAKGRVRSNKTIKYTR
ncbi:histone methyltransferase DOT1 Ecym_4091 [Eremothecium cymbalariae DBVPG|uniref:Histone-lysine N-methyltransferase, H3 lysine-79 specific n=1 Tax=Eremothecium cymbalariae (strain CBS 270.75 / DBVPG 7215 / KCTC 17166 / NRRL Y-17582) TaxID=931890 RepID=G8JT17_ERECY|nr:hypothetical protein Ecym_4091 [Eremothecium cymbalariae DBVPG\